MKFSIEKFGVLYDGIQTKAVFKRNILLMFDIRKLLFAASIVFLYDRSNTCVSLLIMI
jgi:hypothetical protein